MQSPDIQYLYGEPDPEALSVLRDNFDIADVDETESLASLRYNISRIEIAERDIQKIENPKMRRTYHDWLNFFRSKTEEAISKLNSTAKPQ